MPLKALSLSLSSSDFSRATFASSKLVDTLKNFEDDAGFVLRRSEEHWVRSGPVRFVAAFRLEIVRRLQIRRRWRPRVRHRGRCEIRQQQTKSLLPSAYAGYLGTDVPEPAHWKYRTPVLEKASKAVWEMILDGNGLGKEISDTVEKVFRRLSGVELPMPPQSQAAIVAQPEESRGEESGKLKEAEISKPSERKRSFAEMSMQDGAETLANGSTDQLAAGSENITAPGTNGTASGTMKAGEQGA